MSDRGSPVASFPCSELVYRAIRKQWIDKQTSDLKFEAFLRRPKELGGDADGLSVSPASTCSIEEARRVIKSVALASLHVGRTRNLGLDVQPDRENPKHAFLTGLPHPEDDPREAERLAGELGRMAREVGRQGEEGVPV